MNITKKKLRLIILVSFFFIALPDIAIGQISYRATEDALKQLTLNQFAKRQLIPQSTVKKMLMLGKLRVLGPIKLKKVTL